VQPRPRTTLQGTAKVFEIFFSLARSSSAETPRSGNYFIFAGVSALLVVVLDYREVVEQTDGQDGRGQILDCFAAGLTNVVR
jgi:hypothetical protein